MQSFSVVDVVNEAGQTAGCLLERPVVGQVDFFFFERGHEALGLRVVVGIGLAAHADLESVLFQQIGIGMTSVLYALVRVMDDAG